MKPILPLSAVLFPDAISDVRIQLLDSLRLKTDDLIFTMQEHDDHADALEGVMAMITGAQQSFSISSKMLLNERLHSAAESLQMQRAAYAIASDLSERFETTLRRMLASGVKLLVPRGYKADRAWRNMNRPGLSRRRRSYWQRVWLRLNRR